MFASNYGISRYVVNKFVEEHNHAMVDKKHAQFMIVNRRLGDIHLRFMEDCTKTIIGLTIKFNLLKVFMGGYDTVGCTVTDIRNGTRDIMEKMKGANVQMILNQMHKKKENCDGFHYRFQLGNDGKLKSFLV